MFFKFLRKKYKYFWITLFSLVDKELVLSVSVVVLFLSLVAYSSMFVLDVQKLSMYCSIDFVFYFFSLTIEMFLNNFAIKVSDSHRRWFQETDLFAHEYPPVLLCYNISSDMSLCYSCKLVSYFFVLRCYVFSPLHTNGYSYTYKSCSI